MSTYIVYVEDDPESREIMALLLAEDMGLKDFLILHDSQNFMTKIEQLPRQPDLFLLDIHVTPHSGFEMLTMLRQHPTFATSPVIALTASVMNDEVQHLKQAGFNGVISKPVDLDTFPEKIQRILNGETIWNVF
ncbi:MAG: response regulator [Anaerolineae bacterium]|nr:response regulator [Anaerolineae bacterium]